MFHSFGFSNSFDLDFLGDLTDEAAVLGWALTQAGVKVAQKKEAPADLLPFPAADAGKSAPPTPKVTPKDVPKAPAPVEEEDEEEATESAGAQEEEEEPELSETVDTIKNDNNVVVFFCEYKTVFKIDVRSISLSLNFHFLCFTLKQAALIFVLNPSASLLTRNHS